MKLATLFGILLVVAGIFSLGYQEISYTKEEKVAQLGNLELKSENKKTIPLPPILGGSAIVVGIVLIVIGQKK